MPVKSLLFNKILTIVLILNLLLLNSLVYAGPSFGISDFEAKLRQFGSKIVNLKWSIDHKRKETRAKINELKRKEQVEIDKLYKSQNKLEDTKTDIANCQVKLDTAKNKLFLIESKIAVLTKEHQKSVDKASERIKQIYKGERISILHLIFSAKDINTFLDRVYYQKRLAVYDRNLLKDLRLKTARLISAKKEAESEKNNILSDINIMNEKKKQISASINTSQYLINKLRTDRATYETAEKELARQSQSIAEMVERSIKKSSFKIQTKTGFIRPLIGMITSPFGWRRHPIFGTRSFHTGVDIAAAYGSPIHAANSGNVIYTGWYGGYGKVVIINHGQYKGTGTATLYAHMSSCAVSSGQSIHQGQVIGYEGTTGYSTGPHVHFEVRLNGKPTNPLIYVR